MMLRKETLCESDIKSYIKRAVKTLGDNFIPLEVKDISVVALEPLDVFEWCGEIYIVKSSNERYGSVYSIYGKLVSDKWYWKFDGEQCLKIGTIIMDKFDSVEL